MSLHQKNLEFDHGFQHKTTNVSQAPFPADQVLLAFNRYLRVCYVLSSLLDTELTGAFLVIQMAVALALGKDSGSGDGGSEAFIRY